MHGFLFSEHILCKESIDIVKKFDFEILTYLYVLKSPEFIYAIFAVIYVCMCVCMYVSEHDSVALRKKKKKKMVFFYIHVLYKIFALRKKIRLPVTIVQYWKTFCDRRNILVLLRHNVASIFNKKYMLGNIKGI